LRRPSTRRRVNSSPRTVGFAKTTIEGVAYNYRIEQILDTEAAVMQFRSKADGKVIATLTNFACHPEVLNNDQLTSDFCHWYYQTVERAVGGVAIFANGALGGMISPAPGDPNVPKGRDWARAERFGTTIATRALEAISKATFTDDVVLQHIEMTYTVPLENENFKRALAAGIIPAGPSLADGKVTTESHFIRLGDAVMFTMPGEVQPNIGIFLKRRFSMFGDPVFLFGLANDELGYILAPPDYYLDIYSYERSMSVGSEIGHEMVQAARRMMARLTPRTPTRCSPPRPPRSRPSSRSWRSTCSGSALTARATSRRPTASCWRARASSTCASQKARRPSAARAAPPKRR
jgi:hypothetical protein